MGRKADKTEQAPPELIRKLWNELRKRCPRSAPKIWVIGALVVPVAGLLVAKFADLTVWPWIFRPQAQLEVVAVRPSLNDRTAIDIVVRNVGSPAVIITSVELEVKKARLADVAIGGSSSIPVTHNFNAVLEPRIGSVALGFVKK